MIKELDIVTLTHDIPDHGLVKNTQGAVVHCYAELNKLLNQVAGLSGSQLRDKEKEVEKQEALVSEISSFFDKLKQVAALNLEPDLNDGVLLNFAPLWELTPWEEPKKYWDDLLAGKYEWSSISQQLRQRGMIHA